MRLHEDKDSFRLLLETIHRQTGYRTDVLEKDYYVLLILHELTGFQTGGLPAFFKGGTALYKALKTTNRFSEDIDLSVWWSENPTTVLGFFLHKYIKYNSK